MNFRSNVGQAALALHHARRQAARPGALVYYRPARATPQAKPARWFGIQDRLNFVGAKREGIGRRVRSHGLARQLGGAIVAESASQSVRHILFVSSAGVEPRGLAALLTDKAAVTEARSVAEAAAALRAGDFDLVVADSADLVPLVQAAGGALSKSLLDHLGQGLCVLDADSRLVYRNETLASYSVDAQTAIEAACRGALEEYLDKTRTPETDRSLHLHARAGDCAYDITVTPLERAGGTLEGLVALVTDASAIHRLQEKMNAIDKVGRELVSLGADVAANQPMDERLRLLEEKIIRYSRELLHFDHFNLRVLDRATRRLDVLLDFGLSDDARNRDLFAEASGNGISGYVAATGRPYICNDVLKDSLYLPALQLARSSLTVPLRVADQVVGVFNVESDRLNAFSEEDRRFAEMFAAHIAAALQILRLLVVERHAAHREVAADVDAELNLPLVEIVSEVQKLRGELLSNLPAGARLDAILHQVERVREAVHSITEPAGVTGLVAENTPRDPVLSGKRILVADDEEIIRETIASILSKKGAVTTIAPDGNTAVELAGREPFDLVLSDIRMPTRTGYEVFSAVNASHPGTPVILITGFGYDPHHSIVRASKEGLAGVLFKPFKVEHLLEEVRGALLRSRAGK